MRDRIAFVYDFCGKYEKLEKDAIFVHECYRLFYELERLIYTEDLSDDISFI